MRPDPETLRALALRCEAGDETLSDDVWRTLGYTRWTGDLWNFPDTLGPIRLGDLCCSIDAQAALGVRVLTVAWFDTNDGSGWREECRAHAYVASDLTSSAFAPTEPLARLAAILRCLAARAEAGE